MKKCSICREEFKPTNENSETRQCCKTCIKEFKDPTTPDSVTWELFVEKQEYLYRRISRLTDKVKLLEEQNNKLEDELRSLEINNFDLNRRYLKILNNK